MANVVVSALATWNGKALKKAKQDVDVFNKQLKSLARTFGVAFSAAAIVGFSKKAIKAFSDDEAAARRLALQLENTGNAFRVDEVEGYIKSLEKTYAILNDLRGPFQTLLNLTGSVELAQRSLEAALNISAGTGASLSTVISAIASGIRGQTKAIKNLNTGIDANIIASGDMNKIMEALERRFSGQSAARLDTYAGKMDVLKKGVGEATKAIGEGLVDSLEILSRDTSVQTMADSFENMGDNIAYATVQMAKLIEGFSDLVGHPSFKAGLLATGLLLSARTGNPQYFLAAMGVVGGSASLGALAKDYSDNTSTNSANVRESRLNQAFRTSIKYRTLENNLIKAKTETDKLSEKFDTERIGLMKALGEATDAETKLRIQAKLAILDNNEALAKKYNAELEASSASKLLAEAFNQTATAIKNFGPALFDAMGNITGRGRSQLAPLEGQSFNYTVPQGVTNMGAQTAATAAATAQTTATLTLDPNASSDKLVAAIGELVRVNLKYGNKLVPAGTIQ